MYYILICELLVKIADYFQVRRQEQPEDITILHDSLNEALESGLPNYQELMYGLLVHAAREHGLHHLAEVPPKVEVA